MSQEYTKCIICGKDIDVCWRHNDKNKKKVMGSGCKCQVEITEDNIIFYCGGKQVTLTKKNDQLQIFDNQFNTFNLDFNAFKFNPDDAIDILKEYNVDETCVFKKSNTDIIDFDEVAVAYKSIVYDNKYFKLKEDNDTLYLNHDCINLNTHNLLLFGPDVVAEGLDHVHFGIYHNDYSQSIFKKVNNNMVLTKDTLKKNDSSSEKTLKYPYLYYKPSGSEEETKYVLLEFNGVKSYYEVEKLDLKEDGLLYYNSILISYNTFKNIDKKDDYLELKLDQTPKSDMYIDESTFKCLTLYYDTYNDQISELYLKTVINNMLGNNLYHFIKRRHLGYDTIYPRQIPDSYYDPLNYPDTEILKPLFDKLEINPKIIYKYNTSNKVPFYHLLRDRGAFEIPFNYLDEGYDVVKYEGTFPEIIAQITNETNNDESFYNYDQYIFKTSKFTFNDVTDLKHNIKTPEFEVDITIVYINKGSSIYYIIHNISRKGIPTEEDPTYIYDIDKQLRFNIPFVYNEPNDDQEDNIEDISQDIYEIDAIENKIERLKQYNIIKTIPDVSMWCVPGLTCSYAHSCSSVTEKNSISTIQLDNSIRTVLESPKYLTKNNGECKIIFNEHGQIISLDSFTLTFCTNLCKSAITIDKNNYYIFYDYSIEDGKLTLTFKIFDNTKLHCYDIICTYNNFKHEDEKTTINTTDINRRAYKQIEFDKCELKMLGEESETYEIINNIYVGNFKTSFIEIKSDNKFSIVTCLSLENYGDNFKIDTPVCDLISVSVITNKGEKKPISKSDLAYLNFDEKSYLYIAFKYLDIVYFCILTKTQYDKDKKQWLFELHENIPESAYSLSVCDNHESFDVIPIDVELSGLFDKNMTSIIEESSLNPCKIVISSNYNEKEETTTVEINDSMYDSNLKTITLTDNITHQSKEVDMQIILKQTGEIESVLETSGNFMVLHKISTIKLQKPIVITCAILLNNEKTKLIDIKISSVKIDDKPIDSKNITIKEFSVIPSAPLEGTANIEINYENNFMLSIPIKMGSDIPDFCTINGDSNFEASDGITQIDIYEYPISFIDNTTESVDEVNINIEGYLYKAMNDETSFNNTNSKSSLNGGSPSSINISIIETDDLNGTIKFKIEKYSLDTKTYDIYIIYDITNLNDKKEYYITENGKKDKLDNLFYCTVKSNITDLLTIKLNLGTIIISPEFDKLTKNMTILNSKDTKIEDYNYEYTISKIESYYDINCEIKEEDSIFKDSKFKLKIDENNYTTFTPEEDGTEFKLNGENMSLYSLIFECTIIFKDQIDLTINPVIKLNEKHQFTNEFTVTSSVNCESISGRDNINDSMSINKNVTNQINYTHQELLQIGTPDEVDYAEYYLYYEMTYDYLSGTIIRQKNNITDTSGNVPSNLSLKVITNVKLILNNMLKTNDLKISTNLDKQNVYYIEFRNNNDTFKFEKNNKKNYKFILNTIDQSSSDIDLTNNLLSDYFIAYSTQKK